MAKYKVSHCGEATELSPLPGLAAKPGTGDFAGDCNRTELQVVAAVLAIASISKISDLRLANSAPSARFIAPTTASRLE